MAEREVWTPPVADVAVPVSELPAHWRVTDITVRCRRPPLFDDGWTLAGRIRGALGHALRRIEERPQHPYRRLPSAYRVLFSIPPPAPQSVGPVFHNPTRPFVLFTEPSSNNTVTVTLRLFGYAAAWLLDSRAALMDGLRAGVTVAPGARVRAPLPVLGAETRQAQRPDVVADPREGLVVLESPTCFARGAAQSIDRDSFLGSLVSRIAGLAAWHGIVLDADFPALAAAAEHLAFNLSGLRPIAWDRVAVRQDGRRVPMTGVLGCIGLSGQVAPFAPLLTLAPSCHLGSHTAFGMGRCRITLLP